MTDCLASREIDDEVVAALDPSLRVQEEQGCASLFPGGLDGFENLRRICMSLLDSRRDSLSSKGKKAYLRPVLEQGDLQAHPEIVGYALNPKLLATAAEYFGAYPVLRSVQLFYTPQNDTEAGSQLFHFDHIGERQLKLFVYLTEMSHETGPFVFLPANVSARILASTGLTFEEAHKRRYQDEEVEAVAQPEEFIVLAGPAGSGGLVDTTRCLHYGGRARHGERHMMIIQYTRPGDDLETPTLVRPCYPHAERLTLLQKTALGLASPRH